jgi:hypothetical protein
MNERNRQMKSLALVALACALTTDVVGQERTHDHASPYTDEVDREIKSLSPEDLAELRRGGGWGLAKAAELNGVPGPVHLLELEDQIPLSAKQAESLRAIYEAMRTDAIAEGNRLIELERQLENHFRNVTITDNILQGLLADIATSYRKLRYIHLSTHLKTPLILTEAQIGRYRILRGYAADPCKQVPAGHNAELWRKHNNCT